MIYLILVPGYIQVLSKCKRNVSFCIHACCSRVMNEDLETLERDSNTRAGKSTNYSNKCELQDYYTPKYFFNVCTLKINYGEGFLVVLIVRSNVDLFVLCRILKIKKKTLNDLFVNYT